MINEISIEILRKCPNYCLHCSSMSSKNCSEVINLSKFKEVVDGANSLGVKTICFSGGEPFLHPHITQMLQYVYGKGISAYVYTSGICLDEANAFTSIPEQILSDISNYVSKLIFNIESSKEVTYDIIMGTKNCFSLFKQSIQNAIKHNITSEAHFVPMKPNFSEIDDVILFCQTLGISKISFLRLVGHGRAELNTDKITLSKSETEYVIDKLKNIKPVSGIDIRVGVPLSKNQVSTKCEAATGKLNIKYDGGVYPCEVFKNHAIRIKNGIEIPSIYTKNIVEIYQNSKYLNAVRNYIQSFSCEANCENCVGQYLIETKSEIGGFYDK